MVDVWNAHKWRQERARLKKNVTGKTYKKGAWKSYFEHLGEKPESVK